MADLTVKNIAELQNVEKRVAHNWVLNGLFPNARKTIIEPFGEMWLVPDTDLKNFQKPQRGRPTRKPNNGEI